jgi:predicted metal-binding protein
MGILPADLPLVVCHRCGHTMQLIRRVPKLKEHPALDVFVCASCGEVETKPTPRDHELDGDS